jgi:hypothetical protein
MRKLTLLIILGVAVMNAAPFNTVPAYTLPQGMGYVGPNLTFSVPLDEGDPYLTATLWAGYGIFPRFDMTLMVTSGGPDLGYAMLEARYGIIERAQLGISPVLDFYVPTGRGGTMAMGPGLMLTGDLGGFLLHGNIFAYLPLDGSYQDLILFFSPEILAGQNWSVYAEVNAFYTIGAAQVFVEIWPGVSWTPLDWLSVNAACGLPTNLHYITPGVAAYVSF